MFLRAQNRSLLYNNRYLFIFDIQTYIIHNLTIKNYTQPRSHLNFCSRPRKLFVIYNADLYFNLLGVWTSKIMLNLMVVIVAVNLMDEMKSTFLIRSLLVLL